MDQHQLPCPLITGMPPMPSDNLQVEQLVAAILPFGFPQSIRPSEPFIMSRQTIQLALAISRQRLCLITPVVHHRTYYTNFRHGAKEEPDDEWTEDTLRFYGITFKDAFVPHLPMKVPRPRAKTYPEAGMIIRTGLADSVKIHFAHGVPRNDVDQSRKSVAQWITSKMLDCAWKLNHLCSPSFHTMANVGVMVIKLTPEKAEGVIEIPLYQVGERIQRQAYPLCDEAFMVATAISSCQRWKWSDNDLPIYMFRYSDPYITIYRAWIDQDLLDRVQARRPATPETTLTVVSRFRHPRFHDAKGGFNIREPREREQLMRFLCEIDGRVEWFDC